MAFLGHSARLLLHCTAASADAERWTALGFDILESSEHEALLTDGQINVVLRTGDQQPPQLEYLGASLQSIKDKILAGGNVLEKIGTEELVFAGPGMLRYSIKPATAANVVHCTGDSNPVLGYVDALVVPVVDADQAAVWAQACGYFIAEASGRDIHCVDVTDGIWMLSFREQPAGAPFLHYTADIDQEWIDDISGIFPDAKVMRSGDGTVDLFICSMPGGLPIMITNDEIE
ncbi:MAG: hypothetical protein FJ211_03620 [Ignavibacteria bacterium]|nr:hypothetical protein [Ignavibacteria bacterium]